MTAEVRVLLCYPQKRGAQRKKGKSQGHHSHQPFRKVPALLRLLSPAVVEKLSNQGCFQLGLFNTPRPRSPTLELDGNALLHAVSWHVLPSTAFASHKGQEAVSPPLQKEMPAVGTELISRTSVAKGHALIFPSCLRSMLLLRFCFYLATTLRMTWPLGVTCLLFC